MVPRGWRNVALGTVLSPASRMVDVEAGVLYRLLGVRLYGKGCHVHAEQKGSSLKTARLNLVKAGDVVYNKMWTSKTAFGIVPKELDGLYATSEYPTFETNAELVDAQFLNYFMTTDQFTAISRQACRGTTSRARLNPRDFLNLSVFLPPVAEQRAIVERLSAIDAAIKKTNAVIEQTKRLKQGLLQELLTRGIGHTKFKMTEIGQIPESWDCTTIGEFEQRGEILKVQDGNHGSQYPRTHEFAGTGIPYITAKNISEDGAVELAGCLCLPREIATKLRIKPTQPGDVILTHNATVGRAAIVPVDYPEYVVSTSTTYYRVNRSRLSPEFLLSYFESSRFQRQLERVMGQSTRNQVPISAQRKLLLVLPPMAEQGAISSGLATFSVQILNSRRELATLQTVRQAMANDLLTGAVRVFS